jgi:hypothetical protein
MAPSNHTPVMINNIEITFTGRSYVLITGINFSTTLDNSPNTPRINKT